MLHFLLFQYSSQVPEQHYPGDCQQHIAHQQSAPKPFRAR